LDELVTIAVRLKNVVRLPQSLAPRSLAET